MKLKKAVTLIPDILFACKQSTSSVLVPCVSSVQKYKYMLSLHFFFFFLSLLFTYLGCRGQKMVVLVPKNTPVLQYLCWRLPVCVVFVPHPLDPDLLACVDFYRRVFAWCWLIVFA